VSRHFAALTYTPSVRASQRRYGGRELGEASGGNAVAELSRRECEFIAARDSFFLSTVSETGWPHVQHRGGPAGFLRVLDATTLAFADFSGNRQYVSVGNLAANNRAALILMDYPNQRRLKILGACRSDRHGCCDHRSNGWPYGRRGIVGKNAAAGP
jgi:predicted pyridoxine 5'-phosphate oxidase superfamily flavin-nucleotide-binding protein